MRLFPEVIASFATGCEGWDWHQDAWRPGRIPAVMRPLYQHPESAEIRMLCATGTRLRFMSDTTRLGIELRYGVSARPIYKGALLVDGRLVDQAGFGPDDMTPQWDCVIFQSKNTPGTGPVHTFDIWLPHLCQVDVVELEIDDDCQMEPADALPVRWLMYGDSITQGMVSKLPVSSAFGIAALATDAEVFNLGIGGARLTAELAQTIPQGRYDLVSIAYGINDFNGGVHVQEFQDNAMALVRGLLEQLPQTPILLVTPTPWHGRTEPNANGNHLDDFRRVLAPVAALSPLVKLIDGTTLVPDDKDMFVDDVHPNDKGFAIYGRLLSQHAQAALSASRPR